MMSQENPLERPEGSLKFMFSKKATKINEIFTVNLKLCSKCQIYGEDLVIFCGLLRKHKLYSFSWVFPRIFHLERSIRFLSWNLF